MSKKTAREIVRRGIPLDLTTETYLDLYDQLSEIEVRFPQFILQVTGLLNRLNRMASQFSF